MRQGLLLSIALGILFTSISGAKPVLTVPIAWHDLAGESLPPLYASGNAGGGAPAGQSAFVPPTRGEVGPAETSVPEPETFALIGLGLLLIGMVGARRYRH